MALALTIQDREASDISKSEATLSSAPQSGQIELLLWMSWRIEPSSCLQGEGLSIFTKIALKANF